MIFSPKTSERTTSWSGLVAGFLGITKTVMSGAGLFAKFAMSHINYETVHGALPAWNVGYGMGRHARAHPEYQVQWVDLWLTMLVKMAPPRAACRTCSESVVINGVDWASMDWSKQNTSSGGGKYAYEPPGPPTKNAPAEKKPGGKKP